MGHKYFISSKTEDFNYKRNILNNMDIDLIDKPLDDALDSDNEDYIRNSVLKISLQLKNEKYFSEKQDALWVFLTIAEAYNYIGNYEKLKEYNSKAHTMAEKKKDSFAISTYQEQKKNKEIIIK